jgi:hypothetical protein
MVCGGERNTGSEYAEFVPIIKIASYTMDNIELKIVNQDVVLINYVVNVYCDGKSPEIEGCYYVTSLWSRSNGRWTLVFNQDSRKR